MVLTDSDRSEERFRPLRPASTARLVLAFVFGPLLWLLALAVASWLIERTDAIEIGLALALGSVVLAFCVLGLLRLGRQREERRYDAGA
jgi:hypothetical protein